MQFSRQSSPLGAGDKVFPEDWEPVIEEILPPSAEPGARVKHGNMGEAAALRATLRTFHGKLEGIGALEVLKAVTQSRASGIMSFETNPQGAVLLEDGLIVAASWGDLNGPHALAQLLLLEGGTFRVGAHLHEMMTEEAPGPQALLMEALQLVGQRHARSGAEEGSSRPLARPSPGAFRLPGGKLSENGKAAVNGQSTISGAPVVNGRATLNGKATADGMTIASGKTVANCRAVAIGDMFANGNHSNGSGSNVESDALRFLVHPLPSASAKGNHINGEHSAAEPNGLLSMTPAEQNQAARHSEEAAAPARPAAVARAQTETTVAPPAGQLRSKSLWWIDGEPAPPTSRKGETFTRRALVKLRGAGRLLQSRK